MPRVPLPQTSDKSLDVTSCSACFSQVFSSRSTESHRLPPACTERVSGIGSPVGSPAFGGAPLALEQGLADRRRLALVLVLRREEVRHLAPRREKRCLKMCTGNTSYIICVLNEVHLRT